jgi:hypothetical protein
LGGVFHGIGLRRLRPISAQSVVGLRPPMLKKLKLSERLRHGYIAVCKNFIS